MWQNISKYDVFTAFCASSGSLCYASSHEKEIKTDKSELCVQTFDRYSILISNEI